MMKRRTLLTSTAATALAATLPAFAQTRKDSMVLGMTLEPPGLDPTANAASAIGEVVLYNVLETLTKVNPDSSVSPLLAESWEISPDLKTYTFKLRRGVKFSNGEPFDAHTVKFSFDRAGGANSTNKDKRLYANLGVQVVDDYTVVLLNKEIDPNLPFLIGQATGVIMEPKSVANTATNPVGTGPYKFDNWVRGSSLTLTAWPGFRSAGAIKLKKVTFRFISDAAAQAASLLAGDVDAYPRIATRVVPQFQHNPRFEVIIGGTLAKTIMSINNKHKPLNDVRVRRAICAAVNRKTVIEGAADGYGVPIGSHYVPGAPGYVDTTGINPYDPEKAKKLLAEAGVKLPLELLMTLPPPPYARQGGEVIVAELGKVGINVRVQNVEWAQWLSTTYGGPHDYDLTIVSHVEPFDLVNYTKPDYYWGYDSKAFDALFDKIQNTGDTKERDKLLGDAQRMLATDAVNCYLFQPQFPSIAKKGVRGLWKNMPIFCNDLSTMYWA
ncbi:MAG: ABC transporter, substrate-binding protein (cluster 5, nickel/peptides/opines) [Burkholderiaceae bacterium]|jgi:peptide/nickel transport system substrate-binding protein|nr:MAG: ABC transporter, substrate-binding protein (cluster 5, nickel/peptides/opines) [Burkholderiaceae bacterium]